MGGGSSRVSASRTNTLINSLVLGQTASCSRILTGEQSIDCSGKNCSVSGNVQRMSLSMDANCVLEQMQRGGVTSDVVNDVSQALSESGVAGTQWTDTRSQSVSSDISTNINNSINAENIASCAAALNGRQILTARGENASVSNNIQEQIQTLQADCFIKQVNDVKLGNYLTNLVNQRLDYESKNPLRVVGEVMSDAIGALGGGNIMIFVVIIAIVLGVFYIYRMTPARPALAAPASAGGAAHIVSGKIYG